MIVETLTDNRNRTGADVRNLFSRNGGSLAEPGAVSWQFERKGIVVVEGGDEEQVMEVVTDAGAEDMSQDGENFVVTCAPNDLHAVRSALEAAGLTIESSDLSLEPSSTVSVADEGDAKKVLRLLEAMDDHDDVQSVHANYDISDEVLAGFYG